MAALPQSLDSPTVDVASLFEAYLDWQQKENSSETYRGYKFYLQAFVDKFGHKQARSLKTEDVECWLNEKKKKKQEWNDSTKKNAVRNVKAALNWAVGKFLTSNPLADLKAPTSVKRVRCVTDEEYESLVKVAPPNFCDYLVALRFTGARTSELRKLRWNERSGNRFVLYHHKTVKKPRSRV
jgi:integrase